MPDSRRRSDGPNAADAAQVKAARRREQRVRERELNDVRAVLAITGGRRLLWRLMGKFGVNGSVFAEPNLMAYNSGKQDAGHLILAEVVEAQPEAYLQMMQEAAKLEKEDQDV